MNSANILQDKNYGKKKTKATEKRECPSSNISHKKLKSYYCLQLVVSWSHHNHPAFYDDMLTHQLLLQNHYQHNLVSSNPFVYQILSCSFLHFRVMSSVFQHQQRDLKDSFQGVTISKPMPQVAMETSQQSYLLNQKSSKLPCLH